MEQERLRIGAAFLESYWFSVADRILTLVAERWNLTAEQAVALRHAFLRPNDYFVEIS
jgi:hypothetical protein